MLLHCVIPANCGRAFWTRLPFWRGGPVVRACLALLICVAACGEPGGTRPETPADLLVLLDDGRHDDGALTVGVGLGEAMRVIGWRGVFIDFAGAPIDDRLRRLERVDFRSLKGVVMLGGDGAASHRVVAALRRRGLPVIGWHVGGNAVPGGLAVNVTADPAEVGRRAAEAVLNQSAGRAGVVVFADPNSDSARRKVAAMMDVFRDCAGCTVLSIEWMALADAWSAMPDAVGELLARNGAAWTHSLAVADGYFDALAQSLVLAGLPPQRIVNVAAGDGSRAAYDRILTGSYQWATVPEPMLFQGWQLIGELRRICAGQAPLGLRSPITVLTTETTRRNTLVAGAWDPPANYREHYRRLWIDVGTAGAGVGP